MNPPPNALRRHLESPAPLFVLIIVLLLICAYQAFQIHQDTKLLQESQQEVQHARGLLVEADKAVNQARATLQEIHCEQH